jgi:hypothetical protein
MLRDAEGRRRGPAGSALGVGQCHGRHLTVFAISDVKCQGPQTSTG